MKKCILLSLTVLLASFASNAQDTIPQQKILRLITEYRSIYCEWNIVYSGDKFDGYAKTIEITPKDTSEILSIFFYSNTIKDKKKEDKLEVIYAELDDESIEFIVEVDNRFSVVSSSVHTVPLLEAEMTRLLQTVKPGIKTRRK
jgi:hypothetical protein